MFRTIADFEKIWKDESESVMKMLGQLTDASLSQQVTDDHRTLGRVAWHIVTTITEMIPATGLKLDGPDPKAGVPASVEEIRSAFQTASNSLLNQIKTDWTDETLQVEDDMYGLTWKRGYTLFVLIIHQTHHLGQMSVLMRQAGVKVPGIYGPSKEEWSQYGMSEPEV
jgi:uncharacterized damage-inducible protein DinB